ncbi:MAG: hypothetical protein ACE5JU_24695 [Candidatus Binatia bacterium]
MQVVIDKSYLQGASADKLRNLCAEHTVLFIETLLYELLTTEEEAVRRACFAKFPELNDNVVLIPRTGPLFRHEIEHQRPASPLTDHGVQATFQDLVTGVFSRPLDQQPALAEWRLKVQREVETFHQVATGVSAWCPALRDARGPVLNTACEELKQQACGDADVVRKVYGSLGVEAFPCASLLDPSWALFRWVQMHLLFGLDYVCRYGFADLAAVPGRVEHDVHDLQYALLGTLCGALATNDGGIERNFRMACPEGALLA